MKAVASSWVGIIYSPNNPHKETAGPARAPCRLSPLRPAQRAFFRGDLITYSRACRHNFSGEPQAPRQLGLDDCASQGMVVALYGSSYITVAAC